MCGVSKLAISMSMLGRADIKVREKWESFFVLYWGFTIKYLIPIVLWLILCKAVGDDSEKGYGGYAIGW